MKENVMKENVILTTPRKCENGSYRHYPVSDNDARAWVNYTNNDKMIPLSSRHIKRELDLDDAEDLISKALVVLIFVSFLGAALSLVVGLASTLGAPASVCLVLLAVVVTVALLPSIKQQYADIKSGANRKIAVAEDVTDSKISQLLLNSYKCEQTPELTSAREALFLALEGQRIFWEKGGPETKREIRRIIDKTRSELRSEAESQ